MIFIVFHNLVLCEKQNTFEVKVLQQLEYLVKNTKRTANSKKIFQILASNVEESLCPLIKIIHKLECAI